MAEEDYLPPPLDGPALWRMPTSFYPVFVLDSIGGKFQVDVTDRMSIGDVKGKLAEQYSVMANSLYLNGVEVSDMDTMIDLGTGPGAIFNMT